MFPALLPGIEIAAAVPVKMFCLVEIHENKTGAPVEAAP
jgi:hypothetical protein